MKSEQEKTAKHEEKIYKSHMSIHPIYASASTINTLHGKTLDLNALIDELLYRSKQVNKNDLQEVERMLLMLAKTLDYIFYDTLKKLVGLDMINHIEVFSSIAFKAQSQSRKTLATLAELKRPSSTTFINQQNNALAQQVNNKDNVVKSEKNKNISNELLSEGNHEALESRGTQEAVRLNPNMEAMEEIHRS